MKTRNVRLLLEPARLSRLPRHFRGGHAAPDSAPPRVYGLSGMVKRALVLLVLVLAACRGPVQPHEVLSPQVANLRAQFNNDTGKIRIVILPAPT